MLRLLKLLYWDLTHGPGRSGFVQWILRDIPGSLGVALRCRAYKKQFAKVGSGLSVSQGVRFRNIQLITAGDNLSIGDCSFLQGAGRIAFGNNVLLGPGVKIWSTNHRSDDVSKPINQQGYEDKEVVIGSDVWIGANAFIMPGAQIGDGVIISAGSVVGAKQIPPYRILAGNPARVIGTRGARSGNPTPALTSSDSSNCETQSDSMPSP
jgi:maltose O-acetyltransferase